MKSMLLFVYMKPVFKEIKAAREFELFNQLSRSIRSIKNNVNEAQSSESRRDFIHKLKIADKELKEATGMIATEYDSSVLLTRHRELIMDLLHDIARLIGKSISTAHKNESNM